MVLKKHKEKLFVYGTLRFKRYQNEALGKVVDGKKAELAGYKRFTITLNGESYFVIIPSEKYVVHGLLLEISEQDLQILDDYEEDIYERKKVRLRDGTSAWAYIFVNK